MKKYIIFLLSILVIFALILFAFTYFLDDYFLDQTGVLSVGLCLILMLSFIAVLLIRIIDLLVKKR